MPGLGLLRLRLGVMNSTGNPDRRPQNIRLRGCASLEAGSARANLRQRELPSWRRHAEQVCVISGQTFAITLHLVTVSVDTGDVGLQRPK
jgi:hypothetical protein